MAMLLVALLTGCGGGGSSSGGTSTPPAGTVITGTVAKGLFTGGTVNSYKMSGTTMVPYRSATITNGGYTIDFGTYAGVVVLEAFGSYLNESTNSTVTLTAPLRAATFLPGPSGTVVVSITPLTELATRNAVTRGGMTPSNVSAANALVSDVFPFDILATRPVEPIAVTLNASNDYQRCYSMILTGISKAAPNQSALNSLINDWATSLQTIGRLSEQDVLDLQADTQAFLDQGSPYNRSGYTDIDDIPYFASIGYYSTLVTVSAVNAPNTSDPTAQLVQFGLKLASGMTIENNDGVPADGVVTLLVNSQTTQKDAFLTTDSQTNESVLNIALTNLNGFTTGPLATIRVKTAPGLVPGPTSITTTHLYQNGQESSVPFAALNNQNTTPVNWLIQTTY